MATLDAPVVRDLKDGNWIDLVALGSDNLMTFIKYVGIKENDVLWPNWRGCSATGEAQDHANARIDVTIANGYDPILQRMPVQIPNDRLTPLDQGYIFYSYALGLDADPDIRGPESLRMFCYVGERLASDQLLPVAQIKESNDLYLDPAAVPTAGATCVVPPYDAMRVGDRVTLTWLGYYAGIPTPVTLNKTVQASDLGQPLGFRIDQADVLFSETADVSYSVKYADGRGTDSKSELQTFTITSHSAALLPPVKIKGHADGPLNPGHFPDGITLQIDPVYAGIRAGDVVIAHCVGARAALSLIKSVRVDPSAVDSGLLELRVQQQWLLDNVGETVTVTFQYGRSAAAQSAEPLIVSVKQPSNLPAPSVENATAEGAGNASLPADTSGAYVRIPEEATLPPGARVEVHWQGKQEQGRYVATSPVGGSGLRYFIAATAVAANMSSNESKRFPVFYRVTPNNEPYEDSAFLNVRIEPLALNKYPDVQCVQAQGNQTLKLSSVTAGADLYIGGGSAPAWPFMAEGQLLTIEVSGVAFSSGAPVTTIVRNAVAVTSNELIKRKIEAKLPYTFLNGLKRDEKFSLISKVSFDGGENWQPFNINNKITLTN